MLKINIRGLQAIAVLLFLFYTSSCSKDSQLGSSVVSDGDGLLNYVDTFTVNAQTIYHDSLKTYSSATLGTLQLIGGTSNYMLGGYNSAYTGSHWANLIFQVEAEVLTLQSTDLSTLTIDSVILGLSYNGKYGYPTPLSVNAFKLTENLVKTQEYYANFVPLYEPLPVGSTGSITPNTQDSILIDSTLKIPAQIRIPLETTFGSNILNATINNFASFKEEIKGLLLKLDDNSISTPNSGTVFSFNLTDAYSGIYVYAKKSDGSKLKIRFKISDNSVKFSTFSHSFSNELTSAIAQESSANRLYLQSMQSVYPKITFPTLGQGLGDSLYIAQATLTFTLDPAVEITTLLPHAQLLLLKKEFINSGNFLNILDISLGASHYGGSFEIPTLKYTFNITRYVQDELEKVNSQPAYIPTLYLLPDRLGLYEPAQIILDNNLNKPLLKLYFTKL